MVQHPSIIISLIWIAGCSTVLGLNEVDPARESGAYVAMYGPEPDSRWIADLGDPNDTTTIVRPARVALDSAGNTVICGYYQGGQPDLGAGPLPSPGPGTNILVAKYDSDGQLVWSKGVAGGTCTDMALDSSDNVVLIGNFAGGQTDFGPGALANAGGWDVFLVKLNAAGNHVFGQSFGSSADEQDGAVAVDSAGQVLLAVKGEAGLDFGGGPLSDAEGDLCHLARLDATGEHVWSQGFDADCSQLRLSINDSGEILLGGAFPRDEEPDFGGGAVDLGVPGFDADIAAFAARFNADGNHIWSKGFLLDLNVCDSPDHATALQDSQGNVYIVNCGIGKLDATTSSELWRIGDDPEDLAVDRSGSLAVTGGGWDEGEFNACLSRYDAEGNELWGNVFARPPGNAVALDSDGNVVFAGGNELP
ncbi:MAG: hypothetical protein GY847_09185 [Proteobacteria bacterium]|nr:hypothetical protein [Pseudomonadota bacterium]